MLLSSFPQPSARERRSQRAPPPHGRQLRSAQGARRSASSPSPRGAAGWRPSTAAPPPRRATTPRAAAGARRKAAPRSAGPRCDVRTRQLAAPPAPPYDAASSPTPGATSWLLKQGVSGLTEQFEEGGVYRGMLAQRLHIGIGFQPPPPPPPNELAAAQHQVRQMHQAAQRAERQAESAPRRQKAPKPGTPYRDGRRRSAQRQRPSTAPRPAPLAQAPRSSTSRQEVQLGTDSPGWSFASAFAEHQSIGNGASASPRRAASPRVAAAGGRRPQPAWAERAHAAATQGVAPQGRAIGPVERGQRDEVRLVVTEAALDARLGAIDVRIRRAQQLMLSSPRGQQPAQQRTPPAQVRPPEPDSESSPTAQSAGWAADKVADGAAVRIQAVYRGHRVRSRANASVALEQDLNYRRVWSQLAHVAARNPLLAAAAPVQVLNGYEDGCFRLSTPRIHHRPATAPSRVRPARPKAQQSAGGVTTAEEFLANLVANRTAYLDANGGSRRLKKRDISPELRADVIGALAKALLDKRQVNRISRLPEPTAENVAELDPEMISADAWRSSWWSLFDDALESIDPDLAFDTAADDDGVIDEWRLARSVKRIDLRSMLEAELDTLVT